MKRRYLSLRATGFLIFISVRIYFIIILFLCFGFFNN